MLEMAETDMGFELNKIKHWLSCKIFNKKVIINNNKEINDVYKYSGSAILNLPHFAYWKNAKQNKAFVNLFEALNSLQYVEFHLPFKPSGIKNYLAMLFKRILTAK